MTTPVNKYDLGDSVRLQSVFTVDGEARNPTDVTLQIKNPAGTVALYNTGDLQNPSTGTYYRDVTLDDTGVWDYRFYGTGTVIAADEGKLVVRRSEF